MSTKDKIITDLKEIKKSILLGAEGGVTDTAWIIGTNQTIVEKIDSMLIEMGELYEDLEREEEQIIVDDNLIIKGGVK